MGGCEGDPREQLLHGTVPLSYEHTAVGFLEFCEGLVRSHIPACSHWICVDLLRDTYETQLKQFFDADARIQVILKGFS